MYILFRASFIRTTRYVEWLSKTLPMIKKNGKVRVCIDYRNLSLATPEDEYGMHVSYILVYVVASHAILTFMNGYFGYNQIYASKEDIRSLPLGALEPRHL